MNPHTHLKLILTFVCDKFYLHISSYFYTPAYDVLGVSDDASLHPRRGTDSIDAMARSCTNSSLKILCSKRVSKEELLQHKYY